MGRSNRVRLLVVFCLLLVVLVAALVASKLWPRVGTWSSDERVAVEALAGRLADGVGQVGEIRFQDGTALVFNPEALAFVGLVPATGSTAFTQDQLDLLVERLATRGWIADLDHCGLMNQSGERYCPLNGDAAANMALVLSPSNVTLIVNGDADINR